MSENLLQEFLYLKDGVGMVLNNINDINKKLDNLTNQLNLSRTVNLTTQNEIKKFKTEISEYKSLLLELKAGYNQNQPRVPAGNSDGGQWSESGASSGGGTITGNPSPKVNYPKVENGSGTLKPSGGNTLPKTKFDPDKAVDKLNKQKKPTYPEPGEGECATYTRVAIEEGLGKKFKDEQHRTSAKDYGEPLHELDFKPVAKAESGEGKLPDDYKPQKGDVVVIQSTSKNKHGHMAMFNGKNWVSDHEQREIYPGETYRKEKPSYVIYRHKSNNQ